jgi:hypothetical protein
MVNRFHRPSACCVRPGRGECCVLVMEVDYPVMPGFPAPRLRVYSRYSVVAEKSEAIVRFGEQNSRMKDFYDLFVLSETQEFDAATLQTANRATFERRSTILPGELPGGLTVSSHSPSARQWHNLAGSYECHY